MKGYVMILNMKLIFIRHADPDYERDDLTETGYREAEALIGRLKRIGPDYIYVSPLGRAKKTMEIALEGKTEGIPVLDYLQEFPGMIDRPDITDRKKICWDWLPQDWTVYEDFYSYEHWADHPAMKGGKIAELYEHVTSEFEKLLEKHGYRKEGKYFRVLEGNHDTIVFFCHFGLESVLLSYLLSISPMILWHGTCAAPSSITEVYTEERVKGIASFRIVSLGDTSHLYENHLEPSFSARFCECYEDDTRH